MYASTTSLRKKPASGAIPSWWVKTLSRLWATPVLRGTGMPKDYPQWSQTKKDNYIAALAFDTPPNAEIEVIEDE